ncbi:MAG: UvrD-helicase domain-containing protein [Mariprofundales bacterium]|nr:UvrD-helicase domain-containing protein [Mariprofundales bacterium]
MQLNPAQQAAATADDGPQLILAGAGSGKTRTIVHRIGHLIGARGVAPHRILAVTFTNKSAFELKQRLSNMIGDDGGGVVSGTFHSISLRFLRRFGDRLGYDNDFQVLDSSDRIQLIKRLLKGLNIDKKRLHPNYLAHWIDQCKNSGQTWEQAPVEKWNNLVMGELYRGYQQQLMQHQRMDFSDLILNCLLLLRDHEDIAHAMRARYDHLLVDEYQDTNPAQHEWLLQLCRDHRNLTVVGDDDQSIYGWRGADVSHILDFARIWPGATTHRLEENYRSTAAILDLANAVIAANSHRHPKQLRPTRGQGATPELIACVDEYDEARRIFMLLKQGFAQGTPWAEMAVLYRSNRQSLAFEQVLRQGEIPYRIIGGIGFFARKEVKDALAYWSLLHRCADGVHLSRIINTPRRGIGAVGEAKMLQRLAASGLHVADWLDLLAEADDDAPSRKLQPLARLLVTLRPEAATREDYGLWPLLEQSGYLNSLDALGTLEAAGRVELLQALVAAIEQAHQHQMTPIEFLDSAALLQSGETTTPNEDPEQAVNLMSLHRAKGLEFDRVIIAGVEDGLLPHQRAIDENPDALSEERRLLYVGITRARDHLTLTHACSRRLFQDMTFPVPSRFVRSLDTALLRRPGATTVEVASTAVSEHLNPGIQPGAQVRHPTFGEGCVLAVEGVGEGTRVSVRFERCGTKRLMLKYAFLQCVSS